MNELHLTPAQLTLLIEGIDWRRTVAAEAMRTPGFRYENWPLHSL